MLIKKALVQTYNLSHYKKLGLSPPKCKPPEDRTVLVQYIKEDNQWRVCSDNPPFPFNKNTSFYALNYKMVGNAAYWISFI